MRFMVDPKNGRRWLCILTREEYDEAVAYLKFRFAPSIEKVAQIALVAGPYTQQTPFMDVEVEP